MLGVLADIDKVGARFMGLRDASVTSKHVPKGTGYARGIGDLAVEVLVISTLDRQAGFVRH